MMYRDDEPTIIDIRLQQQFNQKPGHLDIGTVDDPDEKARSWAFTAFIFVTLTIVFTMGIVYFINPNNARTKPVVGMYDKPIGW